MKLVCNKKFVIIVVIAAILVAALTLGLVFGLKSKNKEGLIVAAVVSNGRGCAEVGSHMLDDGGSAVDAAIATLLCEGALLPHSMGIGGGFVATVYQKSSRKIETLIARESAPAAAHKDMFLGQTAVTGARAGAVPGELLGYWELHKKYGRLPWKTLFQPTIKLCLEGHYVSKYLAAALASKETEIRNEPSMSEIFVKPDGSLYVEGDTMKRTKLGETLNTIANDGVGTMYDGGEIGKMFAEDIQELGGIITEDDLKNYKVSWEDTHHVVANITGGYTLYTTPLPSSGPLIAFMLNVLSERYTEDHDIYWQRVIETFKHAYGQRSNLGDLQNESEMSQTINETLINLLSHDFAAEIRSLILDDKTFNDYAYYGANFTVEEDHGTANMAVLAPNGDAVTITSTVNNYFGSKVASKRTGIILNDEMDDFSTPGVINSFGVPASPANYIKPGKRPMSSMCPAIVLDKNGNVRMLVGAAGGTKITTSVVSAIIKYLIFNDTLSEAIDGGRIHHQLAPMVIDTESKVPQSVQNYLRKVGHDLNVLGAGTGFAAVTAIGVRDGIPEPFYDHRRVGSKVQLQAKNKMQH
ncbi:glutathione hydrolase 1 proenzyme-like [Teleopsis dalmanni]|uniref:glutathione hydrolase 1 proenzyme-like n=1 Tax=Teleopsis dalmanni TaxID=139649 RepID=UPI0018CD4F00|nr:glutathione hydrolase 1 proenzyme-like [Teleopsis dalmanni]